MDNPKKKIVKIGLAVFRDGKMLLVRRKKDEKVFIFPGGKVEAGESDEDCLKRESVEELGVEPDMNSLKFLGEFIGSPHGIPDSVLIMRIYEGMLMGEPKASSEIAELRYMNHAEYYKIATEIGKKVFDRPLRNKYIS